MEIMRSTLGDDYFDTWNAAYKLTKALGNQALKDKLIADIGADKPFYLVDLEKRQTHPVMLNEDYELMFLPNRLYLRFEPRTKLWVFDVTDEYGRISNPPAYIIPPSDIPATWCGGREGEMFRFLGRPYKGWDIWKKIKFEDSTNEFTMWNYSTPPRSSKHPAIVDELDW